MDREQPESLTPDVGAPQAAGDTTVGYADRDRVAARAYELYVSRGGNDGQALDDWLQAERELQSRERGSD
jgi:hypothetical protein